MKSEKGVTLTSLIVYVIAMVIVVGTVATLTNYFYGNLDSLTNRTEGAKEYTAFNSYFTNEINTKENTIIAWNGEKIIFSSGNQYTFLKDTNSSNGAIYMNKIQICKEVTNCQFKYDETSKKVTVEMTIVGKTYKNDYILTNAN